MAMWPCACVRSACVCADVAAAVILGGVTMGEREGGGRVGGSGRCWGHELGQGTRNMNRMGLTLWLRANVIMRSKVVCSDGLVVDGEAAGGGRGVGYLVGRHRAFETKVWAAPHKSTQGRGLGHSRQGLGALKAGAWGT